MEKFTERFFAPPVGSFFIFGPRGTGKSTWLKKTFPDAYLVDLLPLIPSFGIAATTSVLLVSGYLKAVGGNALFKIALPAQSVYLVLFSASFFIDGLTGITLAILAVVTLALLMFLTARIDWKTFFVKKPPVLPAHAG